MSLSISDTPQAFFDAAETGDTTTLVYFIDRLKWDVDMTDAQGRTALYHAVATSGSFAAVAALLARGAAVDIPANDGRTALVEACVLGWDKAVRALVEKGAATDTPVKGKLPVQWALEHRQHHIPDVIAEAEGLRFKKEMEKGIGASAKIEGAPRIQIRRPKR